MIKTQTGVTEIEPLRDERWQRLTSRHKEATVFHTSEWLAALNRTYGYVPGAITICDADGELTDALVFCRVESWLTGSRIVSVPFADYCPPLASNTEQLSSMVSHLVRNVPGRGAYVELRPTEATAQFTRFVECARYWRHCLDLRPTLNEIYRGLHDDCIRRKIRKAERSNLTYEEGRSEELLERLYPLAVATRRRHGVPPQPIEWFRNLLACLGEKIKISLVSSGSTPAAGIVTIRHRDTIVYKYGFSDVRYHKLGTMQFLLWRAIEEAKENRLTRLDLGRSNVNDDGLIRFKDRWGAERSLLRYWRYPVEELPGSFRDKSLALAGRIFSRAPARLLVTVGNHLYRHIG